MAKLHKSVLVKMDIWTLSVGCQCRGYVRKGGSPLHGYIPSEQTVSASPQRPQPIKTVRRRRDSNTRMIHQCEHQSTTAPRKLEDSTVPCQ